MTKKKLEILSQKFKVIGFSYKGKQMHWITPTLTEEEMFYMTENYSDQIEGEVPNALIMRREFDPTVLLRKKINERNK